MDFFLNAEGTPRINVIKIKARGIFLLGLLDAAYVLLIYTSPKTPPHKAPQFAHMICSMLLDHSSVKSSK